MLTITGTLKDLFGAAVGGGRLVFQLCGFGGQLPRVAGTAVLASTAPDPVEADVSGLFSKTLYPNDQITPAGTFYTVTLLDAQNNVVQCAAYQFVGSAARELSQCSPFDPASGETPAPVTPTVTAGEAVIGYSATPEFDCALVAAGVIQFYLLLTGDVTSSTLLHLQPGQIVTFSIRQDGVGGHAFTWPAVVANGEAVAATAGALSVQTFTARGGVLYPIGPMTVN